MRRAGFWLSVPPVALLLALAFFPAQVKAIVFGFVDTTNAYPNVGAFVVKRLSDGEIFNICSGTLISPTVFLTAAHCTAFYTISLVPFGFTAHISFDNPIPVGSQTQSGTRLIDVTDVITNPNFSQAQKDSGDIGVLILPAGSTTGITPATLPTLSLLDQLATQNGLKGAVFTAVGYGVQNRITGGGPPTFIDAIPVPRMFAFSTFSALNPGYIRLSQNVSTGNGGTCFGDSGGPNFLQVNGQPVLAATTVTGDAVCRATNVDYRLDTASARQFLGQFVTLP